MKDVKSNIEGGVSVTAEWINQQLDNRQFTIELKENVILGEFSLSVVKERLILRMLISGLFDQWASFSFLPTVKNDQVQFDHVDFKVDDKGFFSRSINWAVQKWGMEKMEKEVENKVNEEMSNWIDQITNSPLKHQIIDDIAVSYSVDKIRVLEISVLESSLLLTLNISGKNLAIDVG